MAARTFIEWLPVAALVVFAGTACKDDGGAATGGVDVPKRCAQLAKACGDKDKHIEKIVEECKVSTGKYIDKGCTAKAIALYDCFEKELCGAKDKVWTLDDIRVLADRKKKCVAEATAASACINK